MAVVMAIYNAKGGVGKTTTAINLGACLAERGRRTLLIDFDPQGNSTSVLKGERGFNRHIYHGVLGLASPSEVVMPTNVPNYDFIPASSDLAGLLVELVGLDQREYFLRSFINQFRHNYDYILIDLPPSLSLLTVNGLVAADEVLIPVQAEYYGLEGLSQLLQTVDLIRANLRHSLKVAGAVITLYNKKERLSREVNRNLRRHFPYKVFETEIPRAISLAEAPSHGMTILSYRPDSPGADAYRRLAAEIIERDFMGSQAREFGNFIL
jgi:chromosome partitioning protein